MDSSLVIRSVSPLKGSPAKSKNVMNNIQSPNKKNNTHKEMKETETFPLMLTKKSPLFTAIEQIDVNESRINTTKQACKECIKALKENKPNFNKQRIDLKERKIELKVKIEQLENSDIELNQKNIVLKDQRKQLNINYEDEIHKIKLQIDDISTKLKGAENEIKEKSEKLKINEIYLKDKIQTKNTIQKLIESNDLTIKELTSELNSKKDVINKKEYELYKKENKLKSRKLTDYLYELKTLNHDINEYEYDSKQLIRIITSKEKLELKYYEEIEELNKKLKNNEDNLNENNKTAENYTNEILIIPEKFHQIIKDEADFNYTIEYFEKELKKISLHPTNKSLQNYILISNILNLIGDMAYMGCNRDLWKVIKDNPSLELTDLQIIFNLMTVVLTATSNIFLKTGDGLAENQNSFIVFVQYSALIGEVLFSMANYLSSLISNSVPNLGFSTGTLGAISSIILHINNIMRIKMLNINSPYLLTKRNLEMGSELAGIMSDLAKIAIYVDSSFYSSSMINITTGFYGFFALSSLTLTSWASTKTDLIDDFRPYNNKISHSVISPKNAKNVELTGQANKSKNI